MASFKDAPANPTNGQYWNGMVWNDANKSWDSAYNTKVPITGQVIQTVSAMISQSISTTSSTYQATNTRLSITPKSAASKILVLVNSGSVQSPVAGYAVQLTIFRGATDGALTTNLAISNNYLSRNVSTNTPVTMPVSMSVMDSPATTSTVYYTVAFRSEAGASGTSWYESSPTITIMEIAA